MSDADLLAAHGIAARHASRNLAVAKLYEDAVRYDAGVITSSGALATRSGKKTGRSPADKRLVETSATRNDVWWGPVNIPLPPASFERLKQQAIADLEQCPRLYVVDAFAGWDPHYRIKVRIICSRPYHALFMYNMLIRPSPAELADFGRPDMVIYNAGSFPADSTIEGLTSDTSVAINLDTREMVLLGSEYAGEMKKGVFSAMNYFMPKRGVLSMHCSATESPDGSVALFFGLSGTGKTTLSADPRRQLIGDDEHCWSDRGVFNIEGGCYAKCIGLKEEDEPQIYGAIRFGAILENTVQDAVTRDIDFLDSSITENTRASYPIEFIENARLPCQAGHPRNIIFLTCDAFGVLPPVAKLTAPQAKYHFISGYTAKVAGTEMGVREPVATFSACYGAAFMVWHPTRYAEMLDEKMRTHAVQAWLVNTGWTGGGFGVGQRIPLKYTRAIVDAIQSGSLTKMATVPDRIFGLQIPESCPGCPAELLFPRATWQDPEAYDRAARDLARRFREHFRQYEGEASRETRDAAPRETVVTP